MRATLQMLVVQLTLFIPFLLSGQSYTPVVINGEVFFRTELETSAGIVASEVTVANFEKINGQLYNRVFFKRGFGADELVGYLREDPGTSEIYFRTVGDPQEWLVMDLRLDVGDEITLAARWCDGLPGDVATVVAVNEVEGFREVVFDREVGESEFCEPLRFLEGVGPNATLIFPLLRNAIPENGSAQRICHASHENIIYYPANSDVDLCGDAITSTDDLSVNTVKVFPNPVQDQLTIEGLPAEATISVFDSRGALMGQFPAQETLDCSRWPSGLYVLRASQAGAIYQARFLKL